MMKYFIYLPIIVFCFSAFRCNRQPENKCFKGRLQVKALCMNYTISVVEGNIDTSLVEGSWEDPSTGKSYKNAFRLGSPCSFPASIAEGDEFYFEIDPKPEEGCAVCFAYYPTPAKALAIRIISSCP